MNKTLLLILLWMTHSPFLYSQNYTLIFAAPPEANGTYVQNGTFNGAPVYKHDTNNFSIYRNDVFDDWIICSGDPPYANCLNLVDVKFNSSTAPTPPVGTWDLASELSIVLPVEFISFEGKIIDKNVELAWKTASELNNKQFEIEHSADATHFKQVGLIKGNGTTSEEQYYSFTDQRPSPGTNYYRLKQVDFDGQSNYSSIISIEWIPTDQQIGQFFPNPSQNEWVRLPVYTNKKEEVTITFFEQAGKQIIRQNFELEVGNQLLTIDIAMLKAGAYLVQIQNRKSTIYKKLIIQ